MHHFRYEHGGARPKTSVRLVVLVLVVFAVEIVALAIQAAALIGHLTGYAKLLRHRPIQLLAGLVEDLGAFFGHRPTGVLRPILQSRLTTQKYVFGGLVELRQIITLRIPAVR